jgi:hypothetical protein
MKSAESTRRLDRQGDTAMEETHAESEAHRRDTKAVGAEGDNGVAGEPGPRIATRTTFLKKTDSHQPSLSETYGLWG